MYLTVKIKMEGDALMGDGEKPVPQAEEVARILRNVAQSVQFNGLPETGDPVILRDLNGHKVGEAKRTTR